MPLQKLLQRQLARFELSENELPSNLENWQKFIEKINNTYTENDQERYLLDRSIEISSKEMRELNNKLQVAQDTAKLGYWYQNIKTNKNVWSKGLYKMLGFDVNQPVPDMNSLLALAHEDDKEKLTQAIHHSFQSGQKYEMEFRLKNQGVGAKEGEYAWFYIIGQPIIRENPEIEELASILIDITQRKNAEIEVQQLHQQLITSARRNGMADVATSVLHNVGNILNSANVSVDLINNYINHSYFDKLVLISNMLKEHADNISHYLTEDSKGKLIPNYITTLAESMKMRQKEMIAEINNLNDYLNHIKEITALQKSLSGVEGLLEKIFTPDLIDTAIKMCGQNFTSKNIQLNKDFLSHPYIISDRSKLLQILVNLLQNASDAMEDNTIRKLTITLRECGSKHIEIKIADNGVGVPKENLTKIFSLGFTTKKGGHGFGLHSSAISARELKGDLQVLSEGHGKGSTFVLTIPINVKEAANASQ